MALVSYSQISCECAAHAYTKYYNRHPEIQEEVRDELHKVVGTNRQPTLADRANLPFTDATVMEIQRVANVCKLD